MRAALLLVAVALPAFASDLSIPDAIKQLQSQRQFLIDNHIANMKKRGDLDPEVATVMASGELQARSKAFIGQMHDAVIARLRAQDKPGATVSSQEVGSYVEAFRKELFELRKAMSEEAHEQLHSPAQPAQPPKAVDWGTILEKSRDARDKVVNDYAKSPVDHPGPVRLSNLVIETLKPAGPSVPTNGNPAPTKPSAPGGGVAANPAAPAAPAAPPDPAAAGATPDPATAGAAPDPGVAPKSPEQSASDRLALGDLTGAKADLDAAAKSGTASPDAYALRGELAMNEGRFSAAVQDAQRALQLDPGNQGALGVLHNSEGRMDGAPPGDGAASQGAAASAASGGGGSGNAYGGGPSPAGSEAASASTAGGSTPGSALSRLSAGQARTQAQSALGMNDLAGARAYVDRALEQDPGNPSLLNLRAVISARGGDFARAETDASAGLALAPKDPALLRTLGYAQVRRKDDREAMATANSMMERDPNDAYAYALRAHAYGSMGDRDAMLADLKRAAELDPSFRDAASKMAGQVQLPKDSDVLFLFPGEDASPGAGAAAAAPAEGAGGRRGLLLGAGAAGGLLLVGALLLLRKRPGPPPEPEIEA